MKENALGNFRNVRNRLFAYLDNIDLNYLVFNFTLITGSEYYL